VNNLRTVSSGYSKPYCQSGGGARSGTERGAERAKNRLSGARSFQRNDEAVMERGAQVTEIGLSEERLFSSLTLGSHPLKRNCNGGKPKIVPT